MTADVALTPAMPSSAWSGAVFTLPTSVTDRVRVGERARDLGADVVGRDGHHHQAGPFAGVHPPGAETGGGPEVLGAAVDEQDLDVVTAQSQAQ